MGDEGAGVFGCCCLTVETGQMGVVQRFGKYIGSKPPGLVMYCPPICTITSVDTRLQSLDNTTDCKTKDNVTMFAKITVRYVLDVNNLKKGVFEIEDAESQMRAAVDDTVRSTIPSLTLDQAYAAKDSLTNIIKQVVFNNMNEYGYQVLDVLLTDLSPDETVKNAMNMIVEAKRRRAAAEEQGEAAKTLEVKAAEADSDAKHLSGQGFARMRVAIATGFKDSMMAMREGGLSAQEAIHMMVTTQYLDTIKDFATNHNQSSIMVTHSPGAIEEIQKQVKSGFATAMSQG